MTDSRGSTSKPSWSSPLAAWRLRHRPGKCVSCSIREPQYKSAARWKLTPSRPSREQGWSTVANGELLRVAEEARFDVLLTTDKNMRYQQNLEGRRIAVVLGNGLWPFVKPMLPQVVTAVETAIAGTLVMVDIPSR